MSRLNQAGIAATRGVDTLFIEKLERRVLCNAADLDGTFGIGGQANRTLVDSTEDIVTATAQQSDGKLLVGARNFAADTVAAMVRYLPDGRLDPSFGIGGKARFDSLLWQYGVEHLVVNDDGSILATGYGGLIGGQAVPYVQKFTAAGALDSSWTGPGASISTDPTGLLKLANGASLVVSGRSIYKLMPNGALDPSYGSGGKVVIAAYPSNYTLTPKDVVEQSDGKIVIVGYQFNNSTTGRQAAMRRFLANGQPDSTFGSNSLTLLPTDPIDSVLTAVNVGPAGTIVAIGTDRYLYSPGTYHHFNFVARFAPDGSLDASFGGSGVYPMPDGQLLYKGLIRADGSVVASGALPGVDGYHPVMSLFAWTNDGNLDPAFGSQGVAGNLLPDGSIPNAPDILSLADGSLLAVAGVMSSLDHNTDINLLHVNADGSFDPSFGTDGYNRVDFQGPQRLVLGHTAMQQDGKLLVSAFPLYNPADGLVFRFNIDGTSDLSFGSNGLARVDFGSYFDSSWDVAVQTDGKILVAGGSDVNQKVGETHFAIGRLNPDGSTDTSFGVNGVTDTSFGGVAEEFRRVVVAGDGTIYGAGFQLATGGVFNPALVHYLSDGSLDTTFGNGGFLKVPIPNGQTITALLTTADGGLLIAGSISGGATQSWYVAKLNTDGSFDASFGNGGVTTVNSGLTGATFAGLVSDSPGSLLGHLYLVGSGTAGKALQLVASRLSSAGILDGGYGIGGTAKVALAADDSITGVTVDSQGKIFAVGTRLPAGAVASRVDLVVALTAAGTLDTSYGIGGIATVSFTHSQSVTTTTVTDALLTPNGALDIVGTASTAGIAGNRIAIARLAGPPAAASSPPTVIGSLNSQATTLAFHFSAPVTTTLAPSDVILEIIGNTNVAAISPSSFTYDSASHTAAFTFAAPLATGTYRARLLSGKVKDAAGNLLDGNSDGVAGDDYLLGFFNITNAHTVVLKKDVLPTYADITINSGALNRIQASDFGAIFITGGDDNDTLTFDGSNGNPISGSLIRFDGGGGNNSIKFIGTSGTNVLNMTATSASFTGGTSGAALISLGATQNIQFPGGSGGADTLNITGGTYTVDADTSAGNPNVSVSVSTGANVTFAGLQRLAGLAINGGSVTFAKTAVRNNNTIAALSIDATGSLDLTNQNLLTTTAVGTVRQYLTRGYHADANGVAQWNGAGGINSSLAANNRSTLSIGYATAADNAGTGLGLTADQVLIKPTKPGDANLDGLVDISDLDVVLSNYLSGKPPSWATGDFTYAGQTDISDLNMVLSNYLSSNPFPSASTPAAAIVGAPSSSVAVAAPAVMNVPALVSAPVQVPTRPQTPPAVSIIAAPLKGARRGGSAADTDDEG
jgi:uncharacterized delta-60 repeat protein